MSRPSGVRRTATAVVCCLLLGAAVGGQERPVRGFPRADATAQREREAAFRKIPEGSRLREAMKVITAEPHHAGTPASRKVAEYVLSQFKAWGLDAAIEETEALMPMPTERILELVSPEGHVAALREPPVSADPDSADPGQLPTYNAYSADGDVTAEVVYVNYGTPEDYEELAKAKVDVKGRIVLARYGRSWRGIKPKVAAEHGAVGCIIYSDPRDDGFYQGDVFPGGPWRPEQGVQRGSVMDMPIYPGDPQTPGWGSRKGGERLALAEVPTLVKIPVLPISYGDALPILRQLQGPIAPEGWRGALPVTYHLGPGPAKVRLKLAFDWQVRPLYNVIARIPGSTFPDEWIIHGNHHDAWVNGAEDPTSGNVVLMETARSFGELLKTGWRPRRTIVFASWDGEEWGLLGSTEWVETHAEELFEKAVVYINTDSTGKGWLEVGGSHSLQRLVNDVAHEVPGPRTGTTVFDEARARAAERAATPEERKKIEARTDSPIDPLGSGSDYTAFLDHLTVAALNMSFDGDSPGGIYHSIYDSFEWYTRYSDGEFVYGRALSQLIGTLILRIADAPVLPFQFVDYATTIRQFVDEIEKQNQALSDLKALDLGPVRRSLDALESAAQSYEQRLERLHALERLDVQAHATALRRLNRLLYMSERTLGRPEGLPQREWFKHLVYAPGFYTGYGVKTLPGIREGLEQKAWDEANSFVPIVAQAIANLTGHVERARTVLDTVLAQ